MLPIGFFGLLLFFIKSRHINSMSLIFIRSSVLGFFIPYLSYTINIFISAFKIDKNMFLIDSLDIFFFQSIFVMILGLLITKMVIEYRGKDYSADIPSGLLLGYFICIACQLIFSSDIYLFWPLIDETLILNFNLLSLKMEAFLWVLLFMGLDFLFFIFFGKFIIELVLSGRLNKKIFFKINKWVKTQKFLCFSCLVLGIFFITGFYVNINVLLIIYILLYTLSIAQYLNAILSVNFKKNARLD